MKLKAIIGREPERINGLKNLLKAVVLNKGDDEINKAADKFCGLIKLGDVLDVISHLDKEYTIQEFYLTDENHIGFNKESQPLKSDKGKNLYFHLNNVNNPDEIKSYLTTKGFHLKHTKLRSAKCW